MYEQKYLKYKNKYLNLKNEIYGGVGIIDHLGELKKGEINVILPKLQNCELVTHILSNPELILDTDFAKLPSIQIDIPNINKLQNTMCNFITDDTKRLYCNIYYNKCRIKQLFDKYHNILYQGQILTEPDIFTIDTLNQILLRTIVNNMDADIEKIKKYQQTLIDFGANLNNLDARTLQPRQRSSITETDFRLIIIPKSVTHISEKGFQNVKIINMIIPDSVTHIEARAIQQTGLEKIIIPDSVIHIGDYAFDMNRLVEVTIPESVIHIGDYAFSMNRLVEVIIPESVIYIGKNCFELNYLKKVTIPERFKKDIFNIFNLAARRIKFKYTTILPKKSLKNKIRDKLCMPTKDKLCT